MVYLILGMSYTEFSYLLLQSYDFLYLNQNYNCHLQIGGADQWINMIGGADLVKRKLDKNAFYLTLPLLTDSTGAKIGKSEGNAVWLNENFTSAYDMYQFLFNIPDSDIEKMLKQITLIPLSEISEIMKKHNDNPEDRFAQKELAKSVVKYI